MECKQCGHHTEQPIFKAVMAPTKITPSMPDDVAFHAVAYKRWACEKCGRYHFPDGSLYENPFKQEEKAMSTGREDDGLRERIAKAMCEKDGFSWDASSVMETANGDEPEEQREYWRDKADAVITVICNHPHLVADWLAK